MTVRLSLISTDTCDNVRGVRPVDAVTPDQHRGLSNVDCRQAPQNPMEPIRQPIPHLRQDLLYVLDRAADTLGDIIFDCAITIGWIFVGCTSGSGRIGVD